MRIIVIISLIILALTNCEHKSGTYVNYSDNGDTLSVYNYVNDTLHGTYKNFYTNNNLKEIGTYKYGKREGKFYEYFQSGKLKKFIYYYDYELPLYEKEFDENGKIVLSAIPIGNHKRMLQDTLDSNELFRIGYTLNYSMYERPRLYMEIINKTGNRNDTIVRMSSDTTIVEYDLQIEKGLNVFQFDLYEYTATNDITTGMQTQELKYYGK